MKERHRTLIPMISSIVGNLASDAQITIEPFRRGLGKTVGFALRRTLLSATKGAAVTQVSIDGLTHRFQPIYGIVEDTSQILSNIRKVVFWTDESNITANLSRSSPGTLVAKDITIPESCRIINPNQTIGHLNAGRINIRLRVTKGWGFVPKSGEPLSTGSVALDAMFSPVQNVTYSVKETRREEGANAEKLVIRIQTNGATSPVEVLSQSAKILRSQLSFEDPTEQ